MRIACVHRTSVVLIRLRRLHKYTTKTSRKSTIRFVDHSNIDHRAMFDRWQCLEIEWNKSIEIMRRYSLAIIDDVAHNLNGFLLARITLVRPENISCNEHLRWNECDNLELLMTICSIWWALILSFVQEHLYEIIGDTDMEIFSELNRWEWRWAICHIEIIVGNDPYCDRWAKSRRRSAEHVLLWNINDGRSDGRRSLKTRIEIILYEFICVYLFINKLFSTNWIRDVSILIRCVSLFISQDILHQTYPLSNHHWCSACMPMRHSLNSPLRKIEVIWGGLVWRIHLGVTYRNGYARPNHLKSP